MKVVARGVLFHVIVDPEIKFDPVAVSVKATPGAMANVGSMDVRIGTGLLMVNVRPSDVPPPGEGFVTWTMAASETTMSEVGTVIDSCVGLRKVVVLGLPFQITTELSTKFEPVTVSVKVLDPTRVLLGSIEARKGSG